jgi:hypothetical protein
MGVNESIKVDEPWAHGSRLSPGLTSRTGAASGSWGHIRFSAPQKVSDRVVGPWSHAKLDRSRCRTKTKVTAVYWLTGGASEMLRVDQPEPDGYGYSHDNQRVLSISLSWVHTRIFIHWPQLIR